MATRKPAITVTDHLANIPAVVRPIIDAAMKTVCAAAPQAEEGACQSQKPRSPSSMWKLVRYSVGGKVVVTLGCFTSHASMFFAQGTALDDEHGVLQGTGKSLRYVTLRAPADARSTAVKALVRHAFTLTEGRALPRVRR
jgi:hypothetical protein